MALIEVQPLVLKDVLMQIGDNNYEKALSSAQFVPTSSTITWQGLVPSASFTDVSSALWNAALTLVQDWDTPGSMSEYLYDNEGKTVPASFRPRSGRGSRFTVPLVITPGAIGGAVNTFNESTVNLGCLGKPVRIPGAAAVPVVNLATPAGGPVAGGNLVKVTGSGFAGATAVVFGAVNAPLFQVESDSTLYVVAPAAAAGSKPVKVTNPTGGATVLGAYVYA